MVPNYVRKYIIGWSNYSCKVISHKSSEEVETAVTSSRNRGYRGSKSSIKDFASRNTCIGLASSLFLVFTIQQVKLKSKIQRNFSSLKLVKEQRVDGSNTNLVLRCILKDLKKNYRFIVISNQRYIQSIRLYSSRVQESFIEKRNLSPGLAPPPLRAINPWFITGFADAEGCFSIGLAKRKDLKIGWSVQLAFTISLSKKDKALLEIIQNYWGVGKIYKDGSKSVNYKVQSVNELLIIINHYDLYPLITQKLADFELFKQAFYLVEEKKHLTKDGLQKIIAITPYLFKER